MHRTSKENFSPEKYLGTWYQIAHIPNWFAGSATWNTTAKYSNKGKYIKVKNSTYQNNQKITVEGQAVYLGNRSFHVSFPGYPDPNPDQPNYIISALWVDKKGNYLYSVVTDQQKDKVFVLSRDSQPSLSQVSEVMAYVFAHFDSRQIAMTPHY